MVFIKTYAISFFILTLLKVLAGHNTDQEYETHVSRPRILAGQNAAPKELPFQVSINWKNGSGHFCGGSIIDSRHVLTAGHCVQGKSPEDIRVVAGVVNNPEKSSEDTKVIREVKEWFLHEEYDDDTLVNDIAIIKVSPDFPEDNAAVKPITLRKDVASDDVMCTVNGWGVMGHDSSDLSEILQVAKVPFITYDTCRSLYYTDGGLEPGMICAGYKEGGIDACYGDSGGPLVCDNLLTGVVSHGKKCGLPNKPGVYTDVVFYKEWIEEKIRVVKDEL